MRNSSLKTNIASNGFLSPSVSKTLALHLSDKSSVKWCTACAKKNVNSKLRLFQISFREAVFLCSKEDCIGDPAQLAYVDRRIEELRKKPRIKDKKNGSSLKSGSPKVGSVSSSRLEVVSHAPSQNIHVEDSSLPTPVQSNPSEPENDALSLSFLSDKEFWDSFENAEKQPENVLCEFDSICADLLSGLPDVEYTDTTLLDMETNTLGKRFEATPEVGLTLGDSLTIHSVDKVPSEGVHTSQDVGHIQTDSSRDSIVSKTKLIDSSDCSMSCQTLETNALSISNYSEGSTAPCATLLDSADCILLQTDGLLIASSSEDSITPEVKLVDSSISASCCVSGDTLQTDALPIASSSSDSTATEVNHGNVPVSADCSDTLQTNALSIVNNTGVSNAPEVNLVDLSVAVNCSVSSDTLQTDALPIVNSSRGSNTKEVKLLDPSTNHSVQSKTLQMKALQIDIKSLDISRFATCVPNISTTPTVSPSSPNKSIVNCKSTVAPEYNETFIDISRSASCDSNVLAAPAVSPGGPTLLGFPNSESCNSGNTNAEPVNPTNAKAPPMPKIRTYTRIRKATAAPSVLTLSSSMHKELKLSQVYADSDTNTIQQTCLSGSEATTTLHSKTKNYLNGAQRRNNTLASNTIYSSFASAANKTGITNLNRNKEARNKKSPINLNVSQTYNHLLVNGSNVSSFVTATSQSGGQNTNHKRKASGKITSNPSVRKTCTRKPRVNSGPIIPHKSYILQRFLTSIDKQEVVNTSRPADISPVHPFANIGEAVRPQPRPLGLFENSLVSSPGKINCDKSSGISSDVSRTDSLGPSCRLDIVPLTRKSRPSVIKRKKPSSTQSSEPEVAVPVETTSFNFSAMKKDLCVKYIKLGEIDKLLELNEKNKAANLLKKQPQVKRCVKKKTFKTSS